MPAGSGGDAARGAGADEPPLANGGGEYGGKDGAYLPAGGSGEYCGENGDDHD